MAVISAGALAGGAAIAVAKKLASKFGLPLLKRALRDQGQAGEIAADVIETVADSVGIDPSVDAVDAIDRMTRTAPDLVGQALRDYQNENEAVLLARIDAAARLVENDQISEDRFRSRTRPTVIYTFVLIVVWIVGLGSFQPELAALLVKLLSDLPTGFWAVIGSAVGLYTVGRTTDKAVKNIFGGKI
ncbi:MAG: 3TM-type holin [Pseudomonadota bacterium]